MEPQWNAIPRQYIHPHKSCQNDTTNLSQGYNQDYYILNTAILEKSQRIFSASSKVFKKVLKVTVRIIYISQEKSNNYPKTVSNVHKCFHFKWNKFFPKNYQICKFCIFFATLIRSGFVETLRKIWCERNLKISYVLHTTLVHERFSIFFFTSLPQFLSL